MKLGCEYEVLVSNWELWILICFACDFIQERLTLKHKNSSKWAKRILKRGLSAQDEGTRVSIAEQLHQHALLTRKMNSMKESSDDSSDEDESGEISADSDQDGSSILLKKAKEKTLEVLEGNDEMPKSGVLSLPFMVTLAWPIGISFYSYPLFSYLDMLHIRFPGCRLHIHLAYSAWFYSCRPVV